MAFNKTAEYTLLTIDVLKKMITGKMSLKHVSGPLVIAKYAGETATVGFGVYLDFLAMISISLGVLNCLPIPLLDGGQFVYCLYELVTRRRVPETVQAIGMWVGGMILVGLMILAFYNDFLHLLR
jgi:regulator of sigma E protease